jgi:hypothetical protein
MDPMRTIDEWLESEETGAPFSHCIHCKLPLLEIAEPWLVNKDLVREECVLEYAICQPCRDEMTELLSEESKAAVRNFLEQEIDWEERMKEFMLSHDPRERLDACIACHTPREELEGYAISALFDAGGALVTGPLPLLICKPCVARMTANLSDQSREVWRNFLAEHFAGPPDDSGFPGLL